MTKKLLGKDDLLVILARAMYVDDDEMDNFESIRSTCKRFKEVLDDIIPALELYQITKRGTS